MVIWSVKIVLEITYNVLSVALSLYTTTSTNGCWSVSAVGQPGMVGSSQVTMPSSQEPSAAAGGSSGGGGGPLSTVTGPVEQIALTLLRLQQDMNDVLVRLQSLETLTQQQANDSLVCLLH